MARKRKTRKQKIRAVKRSHIPKEKNRRRVERVPLREYFLAKHKSTNNNSLDRRLSRLSQLAHEGKPAEALQGYTSLFESVKRPKKLVYYHMQRAAAGALLCRVMLDHDLTPQSIYDEYIVPTLKRVKRSSADKGNTNHLVLLIANLAQKLYNERMFEEAARWYSAAMIKTNDTAEKVKFGVKHALNCYYAGDYQDAAAKFEAMFDFSDSVKAHRNFALMVEAYFSGGRRTSLGDTLWLQYHLWAAVESVFTFEPKSHPEEFAKIQSAVYSIDMSKFSDNPHANRGRQAVIQLFTDINSLDEIAEGLSTNRVFTHLDNVYKVSVNARAADEMFIDRYFDFLNNGIFSKSPPIDTGKMNAIVYEPADVPKSSLARNIRFLIPLFRIQYVGIPPHVKKYLGDDIGIGGYGRLDGPSLRDWLIDHPDKDMRRYAYAQTIEQLALIHGFGPLHLLRRVPFITPQSADDCSRNIERILLLDDGFSRDDHAFTIEGYHPIARTIGERKMDSYVKDANLLNWIVCDGNIDNVTAIDFECTHICGPQYDLVKILEHFSDATVQENHDLIRQYIGSYNAAAKECNELAGSRIKETIVDSNRFVVTYEGYVVDHVLKAFHNPNYSRHEFIGQKRDWMQRGMDAIDWLNDHEEYTAEDSFKLSTLRGVFEKYRNKTARLF
jgi:hypothetical protein